MAGAARREIGRASFWTDESVVKLMAVKVTQPNGMCWKVFRMGVWHRGQGLRHLWDPTSLTGVPGIEFQLCCPPASCRPASRGAADGGQVPGPCHSPGPAVTVVGACELNQWLGDRYSFSLCVSLSPPPSPSLSPLPFKYNKCNTFL